MTSTQEDTDLLKKLLVLLVKVTRWGLLILTILLFLIGAFLLWITYTHRDSSFCVYLIHEISKVVLIVAPVAGSIRWYMARQYANLTKMYNEAIRRAREASVSDTLLAMQAAEIVRVYKDRDDAAEFMKAAILDKSVSEVRLIGISLNDFLRPTKGYCHQAWTDLEQMMVGELDAPRQLSIKILLIDPTCYGAYHRSRAEETQLSGLTSRLDSDVSAAINTLHKKEMELKSQAKEMKGRITLEARLYRTSPILNLVQTDNTSFVQQYYFWPQHTPDLNIPVLQYQGRHSSEAQGLSMHDQLTFHFNYLWDYCSISLSQYKTEHLRGCDEVVRAANILNMYYMLLDKPRDVCPERMLYLINSTKKCLYVKGITLKSFFRDGKLFTAIHRAKERGVDVRILLIDPESEEAKFRAFREYQLKRDQKATYDEFLEEEFKKQPLYTDTIQSATNIHAAQLNEGCRHYRSAAECFMLLTDTSVLVEQYHYGEVCPSKIDDAAAEGKLLGKDVPTIEYCKPPQDASQEDLLRDPYGIFRDNFLFVYDNFSRSFKVD